jgi:hypothetical protein
MEKYRCFLGTTRENCCSLKTQNLKDKRQSGVVLSLPGGGFKPRRSAACNTCKEPDGGGWGILKKKMAVDNNLYVVVHTASDYVSIEQLEKEFVSVQILKVSFIGKNMN